MYWDTIQVTKRMMPAGAKLKSASALPKAFRLSAFITKPATTPLATRPGSSVAQPLQAVRAVNRSGDETRIAQSFAGITQAILPAIFLFSFFFLFFAFPAFAQDNPLNPSNSQPPPPGQDNRQGGTIKVDVNLVVLHTTVLDDRGNSVDALQKEICCVVEDKPEQKFSVFKNREIFSLEAVDEFA